MRIVGIGIVALTLLFSAAPARAQEAPAKPAAADGKLEAAQKALAEARPTIDGLRQRAQGLADARAVLQKELDAIVADFSRALQQLAQQAPEGYVLDGQTFSYVKKPADAPKKDVPAKKEF
jgi:ABC-type transporter Mla subunit MlaD